MAMAMAYGEQPRGPTMRQPSASLSNVSADYPQAHPPPLFDAHGDNFAAKRMRKLVHRRAVDCTSTVVRYIQKNKEVRKNLEEVPHLSSSAEQDRKVSDRYNLCKSLAWDSAFLTGEGILNSDELATMNNMRGKAGITLTGI